MATPRKKPEDRIKTRRPTLYKPEYCERIIAYGKQGVQTAGLAAKLGVAKTTIQEWVSVHPEFSVAFQKSRALCEQYLLDLAVKRSRGANKNGSDYMLKFLLSACHGYREKTDQTVTAEVTNRRVIEVEFGDRPE